MIDSVSSDDYFGKVTPISPVIETGDRPPRSWYYEPSSRVQRLVSLAPGRYAELYDSRGQCTYSDGAGSFDVLA